MATIYIVEDDAALRTELAHLLALQGFAVEVCGNFSAAAESILALQPDCVILDLTLPGTDGHSICREVRASSQVPIIMLTSSEREFDEVMGMNLGADDYLTKPYSPAVLVAHIHSALRRAGTDRDSLTLVRKGVTLDLGAGSISFGGKATELTRNELRILHLLMRNPGIVISRKEIMCDLWNSDAFIDDNTLTVNVNRLRRKLESLGVPEDFLVTRRGMGYSV